MNPHPPLSGFPGVLLTVIVLLEFFFLIRKNDTAKNIASFLLKLIAAIAPITYISGYWGVDYANQTFLVPQHEIEEHQTLALLFLISLLPCLIFSILSREAQYGKKYFKFGYYLFLAVAFGLVVATSFHGGELVFEHGAGVKVPGKWAPSPTSN